MRTFASIYRFNIPLYISPTYIMPDPGKVTNCFRLYSHFSAKLADRSSRLGSSSCILRPSFCSVTTHPHLAALTAVFPIADLPSENRSMLNERIFGTLSAGPPNLGGIYMSKKRHTPEQIISKLRESEVLLSQGQSVPQACKSIEISGQRCGMNS